MPLKILLADDSTTAQKLGEKFLEAAGYEVVLVSNGAQALKKINSEKPDFAILDVVMPGYTGIEVCEKIRAAEATAKLPVILTVGPMEKEAYKPADVERMQAEGVIVKPFVEKDLLAAVKKIEDKLAAVQYEATQKLAPVEEVKDTSYEEWKVSAPEPDEPAPTQAISVPDHMASAPAFGMDMLGDEHLTAPTQEIPAPDAGRITRALEMSRTAPPPRGPEVEFTSPPREPSRPATLEGLEPTLAAAAPEAPPGQDPALVTDRSEMVSAFPTKFGNFGDEISVGVAAEMPEVYEDAGTPAEAPPAAEAAAEAPASEPAAAEDDFEARVRAAMSGYDAEPSAEAALEPPPEPAARPEPTASYDFKAAPVVEAMPPEPPPEPEPASAEDTQAAALAMQQEMQRDFAAVAVDEAPPPPEPVAEAAPPPPPAAAAAAPPENRPDAELAAAMAAAMGAEVASAAAATPSATTMVDANTIALIVHRVTERMKPQLIEEIARELVAEAERAKK